MRYTWLARAVAVALALAADALVLVLSVLCIGDACPEDLRVTWWAWLSAAATVLGVCLVLGRRMWRAGMAVLAVPVIIAVIAVFTA